MKNFIKIVSIMLLLSYFLPYAVSIIDGDEYMIAYEMAIGKDQTITNTFSGEPKIIPIEPVKLVVLVIILSIIGVIISWRKPYFKSSKKSQNLMIFYSAILMVSLMIPKSIYESNNDFEGFEMGLFAAGKVHTMYIGYQISLILIIVIIFSAILDQIMTYYKYKKKTLSEKL